MPPVMAPAPVMARAWLHPKPFVRRQRHRGVLPHRLCFGVRDLIGEAGARTAVGPLQPAWSVA